MKKRLLVFLLPLFIFFCTSLLAQQDPLFTYYTVNSTLVNPAMAGTNQTLHVLAVHRSQWVGLKGAPKTSVLAVNTPLFQNGLGLGISLIDDRIGPVQQMSYFLDLSYKIVLSQQSVKSFKYLNTRRKKLLKSRTKREDVYLTFGVKAGLDNFRLRKELLKAYDSNDKTILLVPNDEKQANFGIGVYLYSPSYFLSFSIPRLVTRKVYDDDFTLEKTNYRDMHIYFGGGIVKQLSPYFKIRPTIMTRYVNGNPLSVDLAVNVLYQEKLWMGMGYRLKDALFFNMEYYLTDMIRVSYAYDLTTTSLGRYNSGSHEIAINFDIRLKRTPNFCKRYF